MDLSHAGALDQFPQSHGGKGSEPRRTTQWKKYRKCQINPIAACNGLGLNDADMPATVPSLQLTEPVPGYYLLRLVPKGWPVPVLIRRLDEIGHPFTAEIDGVPLPNAWTRERLETEAAESISRGELFEHPFLRIVLFGQPCTETEYRHRLALKTWATAHAPWHPCLNPMRPIDQRLLPAEDF